MNAGVFTRGFVLITGASVAHTFTASLVASTMALLVVRRLGLPPHLIGITIATSAVAALLVRIPVGSGIDRYGARRFAIAGPALVGSATVLFAIAGRGQPTTPFVSDLPILLPLGAIVWGLGISTFTTAANTYLANTVPILRRAEAVGYFGVGMTIGQGIGAGFGYTIVTTYGFTAMYVAAAVACVIASALVVLLREVRPPAQQRQRIGFEASVLPPTIGLLSLTIATGSALTLVPLLGAARGLPNPGLFFLAQAAASIVARLGGRVADRGRVRAIVPGMLLASCAPLILTQASSTEWILAAGLAAGFGFSIAQPALQALAIDLSPADRRGAAVATFSAAADVGILTGTSGAGFLVASTSFGGAFTATAVGPALGLVLLLVLLRASAPAPAAAPDPGTA